MPAKDLVPPSVEQIVDALCSYPLYKPYRYSGTLATARTAGGDGAPPQTVHFIRLTEMGRFCRTCRHTQKWSCGRPDVYDRRSEAWEFFDREYTCNNCGEVVRYFFYWTERKGEGLFFKVGQYPAQEIDPPAGLKLSDQDLDLYKKALTSRGFNYGIGALSYLRRVVENRMNALLDLVHQTLKTASETIPAETENEFTRVRERGTFEAKARLAGQMLPSTLRPGGHNPFDVLADFASLGMHSKDDDECVNIFDRVRTVFEYLFINLSSTNEAAREYVKTLTDLATSKPSEST